MKKAVRKFTRFINEDSVNYYLKLLYRRQLKYKLLKRTDHISKEYKKEIQHHWKEFGVKINTDWHKWYSSRNNLKDLNYIPEDIFYCNIEPFYNKINFKQAYSDKAFHNVWFSSLKRPVTIAKNVSGVFYDDEFGLLSELEVINRCLEKEAVLIKPTIDSGGGRDICFIDKKESTDMKKQVIGTINEFKKDYIIQEVIEQHEELKCINPESVNTIRTMSFFYKGEVHILSSVLRMGINAAKVDNQAAGGISCGISEDGKLSKFAFDKYGNALEKHPQGFIFHNHIVPAYSSVIEIIKREHIKLGHFKLISWDFAIDKNESPIIIEHNLRFQEMNFHQINNGSLFGELTNEVIAEVFGIGN